jgi:hypothetical protein
LVAAWIIAIPWPGIAVAVSPPEPQPIDGKINWVFDYQEGQRLSNETGKPMFVVFRCER